MILYFKEGKWLDKEHTRFEATMLTDYYNTLNPLENSSQVEGSELSCLSQSLLNNSWKFENNQIILKQSTTTPIVFTIIKRL